MSQHSAFTLRIVSLWLLACRFLPAPLSAQSLDISLALVAQPAAGGLVRQLTVDDAVRLGLEQNLNIQVERFNPLISDLSIAQARTAWAPAVSTSLTTNGRDAPANSFLSGAQDKLTSGQFSTGVDLSQAFPWGGSTALSWDSSRSTSNNVFSNFNPTLQSNLAFRYVQPLLRNFTIDSARQQLLVTRKNREISDEQLRQTVVGTVRNVKNAYWDLAYSLASVAVQEQSLELARQSARDTRSRVEIGTMAPIDVVAADAEVAAREEAVIVAEGAIDQAEDRLRSLILDPRTPDFWNVRFELADVVPLQAQPIDLDAAVQNALSKRTDLQQARKTLESNDIQLLYARNQTLPDLNLEVNYGLTGLGGTQFLRGQGFPGPIIGQIDRGLGSVIGDLFTNSFPNWSFTVRLGYPIGLGSAEATLARARLQYTQAQTQIRNLELQVATQVRDAARQVNTNAKRVETTRVARELNDRRLEAEQKKFTAGTSTSFFVFQAQRDLAQARNNELRAALDYNKSLVDFETVQESSLGGGSGSVTVLTSGSTAAGAGGTGTPTSTTPSTQGAQGPP
jgi:outer membrane protein TolC